jgi:hypothetical protein
MTSYAINVARLLKLEYDKGKNKVDATASDDAGAITNINNANIMTKLPIDIVSNLYIEMLKEIILCDYNHVLCYYNTKTDDGDSLSLSATKGRKKVRMLLTKVEEQRRKLSSPDGPSKPITLDY